MHVIPSKPNPKRVNNINKSQKSKDSYKNINKINIISPNIVVPIITIFLDLIKSLI